MVNSQEDPQAAYLDWLDGQIKPLREQLDKLEKARAVVLAVSPHLKDAKRPAGTSATQRPLDPLFSQPPIPRPTRKRRKDKRIKGAISIRDAIRTVLRDEARGDWRSTRDIAARAVELGAEFDAERPHAAVNNAAGRMMKKEPMEKKFPALFRWTGAYPL